MSSLLHFLLAASGGIVPQQATPLPSPRQPDSATSTRARVYDSSTAPKSASATDNQVGGAPQDSTTATPAEPDPSSSPFTVAPQTGLEEIVVTAQRRAERLQDVPIAVSAFTGDQLAAAGIQRTSDLAVVTPGFVLSQGVGLGSPYLRGVGSTINGPGVENSVATYVDGVYQGIKSASLSALDNIERVEVLKGPQGTLFGRNATGGLVQIITRDPVATPSMNLSIGYASFDAVTSSAYVTGGIAEDLNADLAVSYRHQGDGWGTNVTTGREVNQNDFAVLRSKWLWTPGDTTRATLAGDYSWTKSSIGLAYRPADGFLPTRDGNRPFPGGEYDTAGDIDPRFRSRSGGLSLKLEQELGFADLVSISAYRSGRYSLLLDSDVTREPYLVFDGTNRERQFSQEVQLVGGERSGVQWTIGGYFYHNRGTQANRFTGSIVPTRALQVVASQQTTDSYSVFGQATWAFTSRARITAGLRQTWEQRELEARRDSFFTDGSTVTNLSPRGRIVYRPTTMRFALDYDVTPDVMLYGSYNRGFKSGGFNGSQLPIETAPVRPEILDAFEAGFKSNLLGNRLRLNLSGFYYDFRDIQLSIAVLGVQTPRNAAAAEMYGADLDVEALVTDTLRLSFAAEYLKGRYTSFPDANIAVPLPAGNRVVSGSATGNDLIRTPRVTLTAAADYSIPIGNERSVDLNVTYSYNDGYFAEADNYLRQPAYSLVNARVSLPVGENVTLAVWGRNLLDKFYTTSLLAQAVGTVLSADEPRTAGIELRAKF